MIAPVKALLVSAIFIFPAFALAGEDSAAKDAGKMQCPMMEHMGAMQKDMGSMMVDADDMMKQMKSGAMKDRMQKMHDKMAAMMANMQKMGTGGMAGGDSMCSGMKCCGETGSGKMCSEQGSAATPQAAPTPQATPPGDHESHHPDK